MKNLNSKIITCISVATLLCITAIRANAQKIEIGFRLMPSFSSFDIRSSSGGIIKGQTTLGYGAAALVAFNFSNTVAMQGEIIYNSITQNFKDQNVEQKINLSCVNIPLLLSLNTIVQWVQWEGLLLRIL